MLQLDLRTGLPLVREAFNQKRLQAQTGFTGKILGAASCLYEGPCAVGVMVPEYERRRLDEPIIAGGATIANLIEHHLVKVPEGQAADFLALQKAHDRWTVGAHTEDEFVRTLTELEAKYPPCVASS